MKQMSWLSGLSATRRPRVAASARTASEQQYESEQRQFRAGTTTVFLVLQRQTDLLAARARELQAQTDLNKAISAFQRATGRTLEANQISIRTDTPMRELEQTPVTTQTTQTGNSNSSPASSLSSTSTNGLNSRP